MSQVIYQLYPFQPISYIKNQIILQTFHHYNSMGNKLESREQDETIVNKGTDNFLGNYKIVHRNKELPETYLLKQQFNAESNATVQEISHRINKNKPFSNLITVKDIAKRQPHSVCSQIIPVYLYYDFYPQNLWSEIKRRKQAKNKFNQQEIWFMINEISRGLQKLSQMGISHWDIRPETIYKDQNDNLFIYDSSYFIEPQNVKYFLEDKMKRDLGNLSPEVIDHMKRRGKQNTLDDLGPSNDIFSLGVTILQLIYLRQTKYYYTSFGVCTNKIQQDLYHLRNSHKNIASFIRKLLSQHNKRVSIQDIRKQLRPQESQILRTASLKEFDKLSKSSSQTISITQRVNSFQSPRKPEFKSPEKISLASIKRKTSSDRCTIESKPETFRQYVLLSPRAYKTRLQF